MASVNHRRSPLLRVLFAALALIALATCLITTTGQPAVALDTTKCTARPNADSGNGVLGGIETRVTWEGETTDDELLRGLSLTFPEGTEFGLDDTRVTLLTGEDFMDREFLDIQCTRDGQTLRIDFDEPTTTGGRYRIEVHQVVFPVLGGAMPMEGTYTLADGTEVPMADVPAINVTSMTPADALATSLEQQPWVQQWNENKFLRLFLNPPILVRSFPVVAKGFLMAVAIVLVAFPLAIPFGLVLALMRISKSRILRAIASLYVNVIRGTPVFLQIYIAFFGLPLAGINIPSFLLGVIVLAMNSAAYQCEIFRGGIQSISKGQFEASRSLGMNGAQTMMSVIIPQTVRRIIPTMTSEFILLYKDTSLLAAVGVMEVVMYAKTIVSSTGSITPYIVAACFYLIVTLPLARLVTWLERRMAGDGTGRPDVGGKKRKQKGASGVDEVLVDEASREKATDASISPERLASL